MKKLLQVVSCFLPMLCAMHMSFSQGPVFQSANSMGAASDDACEVLRLDRTMNLISTGTFQGTVDFDPGPGISNLTTGVNGHAYVSKLDSSGNFLWAKSFGGNGSPLVPGSVGVDGVGNIYLFGAFQGTVDFNPGSGTFNLTSAGGSDIYILKLTIDGTFVWAKRVGASGNENAYGTVDASGNIYVTGWFEGTVDFDPGATTTNHSAIQRTDVYVMKLDSAGNFAWAHAFGATEYDEAENIWLDAAGNLLVSGRFWGPVDFDPGPATVTLGYGNGIASFVTKWDPNGNFLWAKGMFGNDDVYPYGLATDVLDNVYSAGVFYGNIDFDPGTGVSTLVSAGIDDVFITKWNTNGDFIWAKRIGGTNIDGLNVITLTESGNLFLGGVFRGTVDFDPGIGTVNHTASPTIDDGYIVKLDTSGNLIWARPIPCTNGSQVRTLQVKEDKEVIAAGAFSLSMDVDPDAVGVYNLTSQGGQDAFTLRWLQDTCPQVALVVDSLRDVTCAESGYAAAHLINSGNNLYQWNTVPPTLDSIVVFDTAGVYTLMVTDAMGCIKTTSVIVNSPSIISQWDLNPHFVGGDFRVGVPTAATITALNEGCLSVSGDLILVLDSMVAFNGAFPVPSFVNGDTMGWNYPTMNPDSGHFDIKLTMTTSLLANIGTSVHFQLIMDPVSGDAVPIDNVKEYDFPVLNAVDPNDKHVHPAGACDEGYILQNQVLTYTINFQNTGNAAAINIDILDTLSAFLDLNTVRVLGSSHQPLITEVLPSKVLRFRFPEIYLPDSTNDEPNSHGYVLFEVKPKSASNVGSVIENSGAIYFDFNAPVITNSVVNTITDVLPSINTLVVTNGNTLTSSAGVGSYQWVDCNNNFAPIPGATSATFSPSVSGNYAVFLQSGSCTATSSCHQVTLVSQERNVSGSQIRLSPNPTHDGFIRLDFSNPLASGQVTVSDIVGRRVSYRNIENSSTMELQLPSEAGMYFITVETLAGEYMTIKAIRE
jgi:uncharacterized repeat protein (TIGR01451 family)